MKISIDKKVCEKNGLTVSETLALLLVKSCDDIHGLIEEMKEKHMLVQDDLFKELLLSRKWNDILITVLLDSDDRKEDPKRINKLVEQLREIFPTGRKEGTTQYWRGNRKEIAQKLKTFFKLYGEHTDEQILDAAKKYVESFNGQYRHMRLLKYFLIKNERKETEDGVKVVEISDMASYIENADDSDDLKDDWTTTIN